VVVDTVLSYLTEDNLIAAACGKSELVKKSYKY